MEEVVGGRDLGYPSLFAVASGSIAALLLSDLLYWPPFVLVILASGRRDYLTSVFQ